MRSPWLGSLTGVAVLVTAMAIPTAARADDIGVSRRVGLGVAAGMAPGFSAKAWVSPRNALDMGLGIHVF